MNEMHNKSTNMPKQIEKIGDIFELQSNQNGTKIEVYL